MNEIEMLTFSYKTQILFALGIHNFNFFVSTILEVLLSLSFITHLSKTLCPNLTQNPLEMKVWNRENNLIFSGKDGGWCSRNFSIEKQFAAPTVQSNSTCLIFLTAFVKTIKWKLLIICTSLIYIILIHFRRPY